MLYVDWNFSQKKLWLSSLSFLICCNYKPELSWQRPSWQSRKLNLIWNNAVIICYDTIQISYLDSSALWFAFWGILRFFFFWLIISLSGSMKSCWSLSSPWGPTLLHLYFSLSTYFACCWTAVLWKIFFLLSYRGGQPALQTH